MFVASVFVMLAPEDEKMGLLTPSLRIPELNAGCKTSVVINHWGVSPASVWSAPGPPLARVVMVAVLGFRKPCHYFPWDAL